MSKNEHPKSMSPARFFIFVFVAFVMVSVVVLGIQTIIGETSEAASLPQGYCDGSVIAKNVIIANLPEAKIASIDTFVLVPDDGCTELPKLYCVVTDGFSSGGPSCVILADDR